MKCEIVTGNMPQLWEDLLSQLHEKEYPSESIRHYREAMGRVDRYIGNTWWQNLQRSTVLHVFLCETAE